MKQIQFLLTVCLALLISTGARAADDPVTCATCHPTEAAKLGASVHTALSCQECHGGPKDYAVSADKAAPYVRTKDTPPGITFEHGEGFTGKPARTAIPETCGNCHANVERMNPYGLRTDQLSRYRTSGHGKALAKDGDERVAVCVDCHGTHDVMTQEEPASRTHPLNIPGTCGTCHANASLMESYDLPTEVVDEYRQSVHGRLLFEQHDTGAPTCATCHGNHSATPPGFANVGAVCGQCHQHAAANFATSIHATQEEHKGCVQCHGGGKGRHFHRIERITKPAGVLIQRYAHLLESAPEPTPSQVAEAIHPGAKAIIMNAIETCTDCHEDLEDDESLPKLFALIDQIAEAERKYVETANRLEEISKGVLLVDAQRFKFEDAKTHLIELAPLQHTLDNEKVAAKVVELNTVCDEINTELDNLEDGLNLRHAAVLPIWIFSVLFAIVLYIKFKRLKTEHVEPLPAHH